MPTIIDELVVQLKLDPKQFDEAQRAQIGKLRSFEREHERHSAKLKKDTGGVTEAFTLLQGRLLAIAGLFMGGMGIQAFTEHITRLTAQTGYLATSLGVSTAELTKWQGAGATVGATAGEITQAITRVRTDFTKMSMGQRTGLQAFSHATQQSNLGPPVQVRPGEDPTEFLLDVSRWVAAQKNKAMARTVLEQNLGLGQGMFNLLNLGPDEVAKRLKEMAKFAPTDQQVKKFKELQEAFAHLEQSSTALGRAIVEKLQPTILMIISLLDKLTNLLHPASDEKVKEFTDKHLPEMGGSKSIFGRIKRWWNGDKTDAASSSDSSASTAGQPGGGPTTSVPPSTGTANDVQTPTSSGAAWLAQQREPFAKELRENPSTRKLLGAVLSSENPGAGPAVVESLFNRTMLVNKRRVSMGLPPLTLHDMIVGTPSIGGGKSFYGPIRTGAINAHLARMNDPAFSARMNRSIDQALAGSNVIHGYTDQGSRGDPNYFTGGIGVNINGERFNNWGYPGSAAFQQWMQNSYRDASERNAVTNNNNRSSSTNIGNVHVNVPPGSDGAGIARGVTQELQRYDNVMKSNEGLL